MVSCRSIVRNKSSHLPTSPTINTMRISIAVPPSVSSKDQSRCPIRFDRPRAPSRTRRLLFTSVPTARSIVVRPPLYRPPTNDLNFGRLHREGDLYNHDIKNARTFDRVLRGAVDTLTLIIICEESCPPSSSAVRLPGNPADSQLEHISTETHIAQWNRAPIIARMQLITKHQHLFFLSGEGRLTVRRRLQDEPWKNPHQPSRAPYR